MGYKYRRKEISKQLHRALEFGDDSIEIRTTKDGNACEVCKERDGTVYELTEELAEDPPIPHEDCENRECRCYYVAAIAGNT